MKKYMVKILYEQLIEVESENEDDAIDKALEIDKENGQGGDWLLTAWEINED